MGNINLSRDWSLHFITPADYMDFNLSKDLEGDEILGVNSWSNKLPFSPFKFLFTSFIQTLYSHITNMQANVYSQGALHHDKAWKLSYETSKKDLDAANKTFTTLEAKLMNSTSDLKEAGVKSLF